MTTTQLFTLSETIAAPLLQNTSRPWEALDRIAEFILQTGPLLPPAEFSNPQPGVWVARTAQVAPSASITGPCIIEDDAEIRHCAFIRGSAIVGKGAVVGNSTELKNCILFNGVQVPHFNYVGDSILGFKAHLGAGAVTSNVKSDKTTVAVQTGAGRLDTGRKKLGALVGDYAEVGCNSVLNPGTILGRNTTVYPTSSVRGTVPEGHIVKSDGKAYPKK